MYFTCNDGKKQNTLAKNEYKNLKNTYTHNNTTLNTLNHYNITTTTIYNNNKLLKYKTTFESYSNVKITRLTNKLKYKTNFTNNYDEKTITISPEYTKNYTTLAPPNNNTYQNFQT